MHRVQHCFVAVIALICVIHTATAFKKGMFVDTKSSSAFPAMWFPQFLDHFDANGQETTFQQRYYINDAYYKPGGPILLYINGEGPVAGPPSAADNFVVILAQQFGATIATLEHRYYGASVPFAELTTENLRFLSSKQALYDLAVFAESFLKVKYGDAPLVTIGGSYSGALSAWFRLKFPHITRGSLSSSGVVNAILDFTAFDEQVRLCWYIHNVGLH
jgi:hypothetical protein